MFFLRSSNFRFPFFNFFLFAFSISTGATQAKNLSLKVKMCSVSQLGLTSHSAEL